MSLARTERQLRASAADLNAACADGSWKDLPSFDVPNLRRYWIDAEFRAACDAEQVRRRAEEKARFDRVRDRALERLWG